MTKWIERYRRAAEERFQRLDALLDRMADENNNPEQNPSEKGKAS